MKWLVRGVALLITCSIYTLLQYADFLFLGGIGAGLLTIALFGLGVWFIPNRIIRHIEKKKAAPPPPPPREAHVRRETLYNFTVDGQSICIPESQLASFQAAPGAHPGRTGRRSSAGTGTRTSARRRSKTGTEAPPYSVLRQGWVSARHRRACHSCAAVLHWLRVLPQ